MDSEMKAKAKHTREFFQQFEGKPCECGKDDCLVRNLEYVSKYVNGDLGIPNSDEREEFWARLGMFIDELVYNAETRILDSLQGAIIKAVEKGNNAPLQMDLGRLKFEPGEDQKNSGE